MKGVGCGKSVMSISIATSGRDYCVVPILWVVGGAQTVVEDRDELEVGVWSLQSRCSVM